MTTPQCAGKSTDLLLEAAAFNEGASSLRHAQCMFRENQCCGLKGQRLVTVCSCNHQIRSVLLRNCHCLEPTGTTNPTPKPMQEQDSSSVERQLRQCRPLTDRPLKPSSATNPVPSTMNIAAVVLFSFLVHFVSVSFETIEQNFAVS